MSGIRPTRLQHVVLWVGNVERSTKFYCDVLGLEVSRGRPGMVFLKIPGNPDDHDLGLFEQPGALPPDERTARMYHMAWEVAELPDLARAQKELAEVGSLVGSSNHGTSLSLYAKDPDGLEFEVFWTVPGGVAGRRTALDIEGEAAKRGISLKSQV
ncbi:MAG: VOC family protein [Vicinamibacterales bacterium]